MKKIVRSVNHGNAGIVRMVSKAVLRESHGANDSLYLGDFLDHANARLGERESIPTWAHLDIRLGPWRSRLPVVSSRRHFGYPRGINAHSPDYALSDLYLPVRRLHILHGRRKDGLRPRSGKLA